MSDDNNVTSELAYISNQEMSDRIQKLEQQNTELIEFVKKNKSYGRRLF